MSRGKNIRSFEFASCHVPCELVSCEARDEETCAPANEMSTGTARIHAHFFMEPPKRFCSGAGNRNQANRFLTRNARKSTGIRLHRAQHCSAPVVRARCQDGFPRLNWNSNDFAMCHPE